MCIRDRHEAVTTVDTASEALAVSISEKACVDMAYMEQLTGKTGEELADELRGVIFRVPGQTEPDGTPHYVTADEYLSGNVRRKLRQAQRAAEQEDVYKRQAPVRAGAALRGADGRQHGRVFLAGPAAHRHPGRHERGADRFRRRP